MAVNLDRIKSGICFKDKELGCYRVYATTSDDRTFLMNYEEIHKKIKGMSKFQKEI